MLYYFRYKSLPELLKNNHREYSLDVLNYTLVKVKISNDGYLSFYFNIWDDWNKYVWNY